jgi:hypothetical protein
VTEFSWTPGILAAAIGLVAGTLAAWRNARSADPRAAVQSADPLARLEDLRQRRDALMESLKEIKDMERDAGPGAALDRPALEREAAEVLRQLHEAEAWAATRSGDTAASPSPAQAAAGASSPAAASAPTPARSSGLSAEFRGMLKGGAVVAFFAGMLLLLGRSTNPREEGMGLTGRAGNAPPAQQPAGRVPLAGETGGPVAGVPDALRPQASAAVDIARARISADPNRIEPWVELGWALADAGGWIDLFETAREIEKRDPGNADGRVMQAMVRTVMGQHDAARGLLQEALQRAPGHPMALQVLASLDAEPAGAPGSATTASETSAETAPGPVRGRLVLAPGAKPPPSGVLFLMARPAGRSGGPPLASKRLAARSFPLDFEIGPQDRMMGGEWPARLSISARLDADGDPISKGPEDLLAPAAEAEAGSSGLELALGAPAPPAP